MVFDLNLQSRGFLRLPLLDPSHIPVHIVLLYFMSVAFSKYFSCVSRCAREILYVYCCIIDRSKSFISFAPITIPLMSFSCLIFSKIVLANMMDRVIENRHPCRSPLFTRKFCDKRPFILTCVSMF